MGLIKKISDNKNLIIFILGIVVTLLFLKQCNSISSLKQDIKHAKEDADINLNNLKASIDTITILKNVNGDNISQIRSYQLDLSKKDQELNLMVNKYKRALKLSEDLSKVNSLLSVDLGIKDSLIANLKTSELDSITTKLEFDSFDDFGNGNSRNLFGSMLITKTPFGLKYGNPSFNISQTINLMAAIENVDGADRLKLTTTYPGMEIKGIENINLINSRLNSKPEKKSGWSIGLGVGYGINLNNDQVISFGPSIGVGCFYSPKWLRF